MTSIQKQIEAIAKKRTKDLVEIYQASTIRVGNQVIQGTPVDKGRLINQWNTAIGASSYEDNKSDNPSGSQAYQELIQTITNSKLGVTAYFTNPMPYGPRIEYDGWSAKAPNGMLRINTAKWQEIVQSEINKRK